MVVLVLAGELAIKVTAAHGALDTSLAIALAVCWLAVVLLPGAWLQARAEHRPLSEVLRRAMTRAR